MDQATPAQVAAQNAALRQALLATAPRMSKNLGSFSGSTGGVTRIKLFNVGLTTAIYLHVTVSYTVGTHATALSQLAPYNFISRLTLTDFDTTTRISLTGPQLWAVNTRRYGWPYGFNSDGTTDITAIPNVDIATGAGTADFILEVPLAVDPERDLRGAVMAQTSKGEWFLNIDWASTIQASAEDQDSPFYVDSSSTVTSVSMTVQAQQEFLFPQAVPLGNGQTGLPIPPIDIMTVYEMNGVRTSDNLAANSEKLIDLPNQRALIAMGLIYVVDGVSDNLFTRIREIANGSQTIKDQTGSLFLFKQRKRYHSDLYDGMHILDWSGKPYQTAQYGQLQLGVTPSAIGSTSQYIDVHYESLYAKGTSMPGLAQTG